MSVQSMARSAWDDISGNLREIREAAALGCEVMRLAVPSVKAAAFFGKIAATSELPLVADTHFDSRVTLAAIREGAAKVRINPGNMDPVGLDRVVDAAGEKGIPIRIGGNSGSILHRSGKENAGDVDMAEIMVNEALAWAEKMQARGFKDIVLSFKSSDAGETVRANRLASKRSDLPLHLGVTSAGSGEIALMKSAAAMGSLLLDGIGDTIRFSFTGDLPGEVRAGVLLLHSLGLDGRGVRMISCPACGRCRVDLPGLARTVEKRLAHIEAPVKVAVMGCEVNGPGEAAMADAGIASAGGILHVFVNGVVVAKAEPAEAVELLAQEVEKAAARQQ